MDSASKDIAIICNYPEVAVALLRLCTNAAAVEQEQAQHFALQAVLDDKAKPDAIRHMGRVSAFNDLKYMLEQHIERVANG